MHFIQNYKKYGIQPTTHDIIKCLALCTMIIDHIGVFFFPNEYWFRAIGRTTVPVWFFLAGYARPSKFGYELLILSALMVLADALLLSPIFPINILATILCCRLFIAVLEKYAVKEQSLSFLTLALIIWMPFSIPLFEYGTQALLFALTGYMAKHYAKTRNTQFVFIISLCLYLLNQLTDLDYNMPQSTVIISGVIATTLLLYHFTLHTIDTNRFRPLQKAAMFCGRNSLYLYFLHYIAFLIISWQLHPERYTAFRWFS